MLREMREQREAYFEIRPFTGPMELLDEIVASPARVSIRRNGKTEYLIRVNGHGFRMRNRPLGADREDRGPALRFEFIDPEHAPGSSGRVDHLTDPERPELLGRLEGYDTSIHIEQMNGWNFWAGIGSGSYSFIPEGREGHGLRLTRLWPEETAHHFGEENRGESSERDDLSPIRSRPRAHSASEENRGRVTRRSG